MTKPASNAIAHLMSAIAALVMLSSAALAGEAPNVRAAKGIYAAFGKGDAAGILEITHPDVHWEVVGQRSDCSCFGVRKGKQGVAEFLKIVEENYAFTDFRILEIDNVGDKVFVQGHYSATNKATRKSFSSDWIHVLVFKDGKLVSFREFLDTASEVAAGRS